MTQERIERVVRLVEDLTADPNSDVVVQAALIGLAVDGPVLVLEDGTVEGAEFWCPECGGTQTLHGPECYGDCDGAGCLVPCPCDGQILRLIPEQEDE